MKTPDCRQGLAKKKKKKHCQKLCIRNHIQILLSVSELCIKPRSILSSRKCICIEPQFKRKSDLQNQGITQRQQVGGYRM